MSKIFEDFDMSSFWAHDDEDYIGEQATEAMFTSVESKTGYKLPASYIELITTQNGGTPVNTAFRTRTPTSWADDHIMITGILGVDESASFAIDNELWIEEWGYPPLGIYVCDCPSGGHDMICLDYRECGPTGEPSVVHVDQEFDYKVTHLADSFEAFIRGLVHEDDIES